MIPNSEQRFNDALSAVPPLPGSVYHGTMARIRRRLVMRISTLAAAASLVIALGVIQMHRSSVATSAVSSDVAEELQYVGEYLNGDQINSELAVYVSYDDSQTK